MAGIVWSDEARQDLDSIFMRLERESLSNARRWINEVFHKLSLLENFPHLGKSVAEIRIYNVREVLAGQYRILYTVGSGDRIEILAIRHTARPLSEY